MPGLINGHVHLTQALIKGCADDTSLVDFLQHRVWRLMGHYEQHDAKVSAQLCALEMIKSGTTTFAETLLTYKRDARKSVCLRKGKRHGYCDSFLRGSGRCGAYA